MVFSVLRSAYRGILNFNTRHEIKRVKNSLAHCGERVTIRLPCIVECPERVEFHDDVSANPYLHIWGNGGVTVGARTMIASHVAIVSATHDPDAREMWRSLLMAPVRIANDVWIGTHAAILPGVSIGEHSVVAAGAVVRKDVPPYSIVAGVPAAIVRRKQNTATSADGCAAHGRHLTDHR